LEVEDILKDPKGNKVIVVLVICLGSLKSNRVTDTKPKYPLSAMVKAAP